MYNRISLIQLCLSLCLFVNLNLFFLFGTGTRPCVFCVGWISSVGVNSATPLGSSFSLSKSLSPVSCVGVALRPSMMVVVGGLQNKWCFKNGRTAVLILLLRLEAR